MSTLLRRLLVGALIPITLVAGYTWLVLSWSYSSGERAGWVQKFSHKGWLCKTWEGELAMVSVPGTTVEKFLFTVHDPAAVEAINRSMGKRVALHYEEKMGIPTSCFGETRYFVGKVISVDEGQATQRIMPPLPAKP
ncbi:MAG: hypothetical protein HY777_10615 [Betaproteobacteria bacterium]|nr:hypothetical protein [Betaproteobacteria bacterium]